MNAQEFKEWQEFMGYSNTTAAEKVEKCLSTIVKYRAGAIDIPPLVEFMCRFLENKKRELEDG